MYEIFAVLAGVVIGLITGTVATTQLKVAMLGLGSAISGAIISSVSGEVFVSWAYVVFDASQVLIAACAAAVAVAAWRHRVTRVQ